METENELKEKFFRLYSGWGELGGGVGVLTPTHLPKWRCKMLKAIVAFEATNKEITFINEISKARNHLIRNGFKQDEFGNWENPQTHHYIQFLFQGIEAGNHYGSHVFLPYEELSISFTPWGITFHYGEAHFSFSIGEE